jgi:hypothetical protein
MPLALRLRPISGQAQTSVSPDPQVKKGTRGPRRKTPGGKCKFSVQTESQSQSDSEEPDREDELRLRALLSSLRNEISTCTTEFDRVNNEVSGKSEVSKSDIIKLSVCSETLSRLHSSLLDIYSIAFCFNETSPIVNCSLWIPRSFS